MSNLNVIDPSTKFSNKVGAQLLFKLTISGRIALYIHNNARHGAVVVETVSTLGFVVIVVDLTGKYPILGMLFFNSDKGFPQNFMFLLTHYVLSVRFHCNQTSVHCKYFLSRQIVYCFQRYCYVGTAIYTNFCS